MQYDTIVIGAGAAGLFVTQQLAKQHQKVLLLERNAKAGKKVLVAGSGQCNLTHAGDLEDFFSHYGDNAKFLKKALTTFTNEECRAFFKKIGVETFAREDGKVFPKSLKSETVVDALLEQIKKYGGKIQYEVKIEDICFEEGLFTVMTAQGKGYMSRAVVVATGGMSYQVLGSDGSGYKLAKKFKHRIIEPKPGLTYVETKEQYFQAISGVSLKNIHISIWRHNKKIKEHTADLLFTHKGISGPAILNTSRWMEKDDEILLNYIYPRTYEEIKEQFTKEIPQKGQDHIATYLKQFNLPKNLLLKLLEVIEIAPSTQCAKISKKQRTELVNVLTRHAVTIKKLGGFHVAMVTVGGVGLKEVNPTTMESRKRKGLYFIGEVLDIDGDTGGYNIQAAFSTAYIAAEHITK